MVGRGWSLAFTKQGNMNADEISIFQSFVQVNILDDGLFAGYATRQAEVLDLLDCADVLMILVRGIVAEHIHVEAGAFLDHGEPDAAGADNGDRFACNLVA